MSNRRGTYYYKVFPEIISISFFLSNSVTPLYCHYEYNVIARSRATRQSHRVNGIKEILVKEKKYEMGMMRVFREDVKIDLKVTAIRN